MMETADVQLPLRNGTTIQYRGTLEESADDGATWAPLDCTGCTLRADVRLTANKKGPAKLSLSTALPATANGSSLAWADAAGGVYVLTIEAADSAALPTEDEMGTDVELVSPSGYVDRPLRITWTPDGEYTHE